VHLVSSTEDSSFLLKFAKHSCFQNIRYDTTYETLW